MAHAQVLAAQRGKEAAEEREQNVSLREQVEALRSSAASAAQVRLLTADRGIAWRRSEGDAARGQICVPRLDGACFVARLLLSTLIRPHEADASWLQAEEATAKAAELQAELGQTNKIRAQLGEELLKVWHRHFPLAS